MEDYLGLILECFCYEFKNLLLQIILVILKFQGHDNFLKNEL